MRVYPGVLTVRDVARWLCASPTTERASTVLIVAGAGLALGTACWGLARVSNLVLAPRTFLVLFTLAWLAYACGALWAAQLRGRVPVGVIPPAGVLTRPPPVPA